MSVEEEKFKEECLELLDELFQVINKYPIHISRAVIAVMAETSDRLIVRDLLKKKTDH